MTRVVHFDIDKSFAPYFSHEKYPFALTTKNLARLKKPDQIDIATFKSDSKIDKGLLALMTNLRALITRTVGINHIDLSACRKAGIAVYHVPDYGAFAIAEHVFAMLLSRTRKISDLSVQTKNGRFCWRGGQGYTLKDKTLGIIGIGKTGRETVKIARGFQMKVLGYDIYKDAQFAQAWGLHYVLLDKLLEKSDVISVNIPLTKETYHLLSDKQMKLCKKGAILVNVSRGEIIDTKALVANLGKFKYVCLDVLEGEEHYNFSNPLLKKLAGSPKVCITPHVAFFTDLTTQQIAKITNENIVWFKRGDKTNRII